MRTVDIGRLRDQLAAFLLENDRSGAEGLLMGTLADMPPMERIDAIIAPTMERIGNLWEKGEVALSQIYQGSKICDDLVQKMLVVSNKERKTGPKIAVACLEDHHMLGIRVVSLAVRSAGFDVIDYGHVTAEDLIKNVRQDGVEYLLISTLMLRSALRVRAVSEGLDSVRCKVTIIVGGAPFRFDRELFESVLADFTSPNPMGAVSYIIEREASK